MKINTKPVYKVVDVNYKSMHTSKIKRPDARNMLLLTYNIGTLVSAPKDTFGIFCFETLETANAHHDYYRNTRVLKVLPMGRQLKTPAIVCDLTKDITINFIKNAKVRFFDVNKWRENWWPTDEQTVCYESVYVIQE